MKKVMSSFYKACTRYNLIEENDKIAIAVSGGKDSMCLLKAFSTYKMFSKVNFEVIAVTINPGFLNFDTDIPRKFCETIGIEFFEVKKDIKEIVFDVKNEKNPCSLCSTLRRGMLYDTAKKNGCNKIALGHNADDVIETLLMNIFYNGKLNTFAPKYKSENGTTEIIRPLILTFESSIKSSVNRNNIPVMTKCCPADGVTKREYTKEMIVKFAKSIPYLKRNILNSITGSNLEGWK